jgi:hypothetical protein
MADVSNVYRAALGKHRLMPILISSSRATVGLPPFISFSTSYAELGSGATVLRTVLSCSWRQASSRIRTGDRSVQSCR